MQDLPILGLLCTNLAKIFLVFRAVGRSKNPGVPVVIRRHNLSPLVEKSRQNISSSVGGTKSRAFPNKSCQNISSSGGFTKTSDFTQKSCQNISSSVGMTKKVAK